MPEQTSLLLILSLAVYGEGAHLLDGDRDAAALETAFVFLNRLDSPAFPDTPLGVIRSGFWGYYTVARETPPDWATKAAKEALRKRDWWHQEAYEAYACDRSLPPIPSDSFYLFSFHDLKALGLEKPQRKCYSSDNGFWGLCFYSNFPVKNTWCWADYSCCQ